MGNNTRRVEGGLRQVLESAGNEQVELQLLRPIPAKPEFGLPEVWTIKIYVCQACLEPDDVLTEDEPEPEDL